MQTRSQSVQDRLKLNLSVSAGGQRQQMRQGQQQQQNPSGAASTTSGEIGSMFDKKAAPMKQPERVSNRIPEDVQQRPKEVFDFFQAESMVKRMVSDGMYPILIKFPSVQSDIKHLQAEMRLLQGNMKKHTKEISHFMEMSEQLREQERMVKGFEQTFKTNCLAIQEQMNKQDSFNDRFTNKFEEIYDRIIEDKKILDRRFRAQDHKYEMHDEKLETFIRRFDGIYATLNDERKQSDKRLFEFQNEVTSLNYLMDQVRTDFKTEVRNMLQEITEKRNKDQLKLYEVKQQIKELKMNRLFLDQLERQLQDCLKKQSETNYLQDFLAKQLPILIHTQICEALDKVVGEHYPRQLLSYEKMKNQNLRNYCETADYRCIKVMNTKLPVFLKYMTDNELGCLPFTYGDDVFPTMSEELRYHIDQSKIIRLRQRYDDIMINQQNLQDAIAFLTREGSQNFSLVEYKLKKLTKLPQIMQLRDAMLEFKVLKSKIYEDFDIYNLSNVQEQIEMLHQGMVDLQRVQQNAINKKRASMIKVDLDQIESPSNKQKQEQSSSTVGKGVGSPSNASQNGQRDSVGRGGVGQGYLSPGSTANTASSLPKKPIGGSMLRGQIQIPEQMFLIRTEVSKPYYRFQAKFLKLFQDCFGNFENFKSQNIKNFSQQAQIIAEIGVQIEGFREQVRDIQDQVDDNDAKQFEETIKLKHDSSNRFEVLEKNDKDLKLQLEQLEHSQLGSEKLVQELQVKMEKHMGESKHDMNKFFTSIKDDSCKTHQILLGQMTVLKNEMASMQQSIENTLKKDLNTQMQSQKIKQALASNIQMKVINQQIQINKTNLEQQIITKAEEAEKLIKQETQLNMSALRQQLTQNLSPFSSPTLTPTNIPIDPNGGNSSALKVSSPSPSPAPTGDGTNPPRRRQLGVATNLKQAEKNRLMRQQEEKRKKAEAAKQKQEEREERAEILKREKEMKEQQYQRQLQKEQQYEQQLEERKKLQEERRKRKDAFQSNTKALELSKNFVKDLQHQEKKDRKQSNIFNKKQGMLMAQIQTKQSKGMAENNIESSKKDGKQARKQAGKAGPTVSKNENDEFTEESDDSSDNGRRKRQPSIDLEALNKHMNDKISESKVEVMKFLTEKMGKQVVPLEIQVKEFGEQIKIFQTEVSQKQDLIAKKLDELCEDYYGYKKDSSYKIDMIDEILTQEQYGIRKTKMELKGEVKSELMKLQDYTADSNYEFTRLNTFIINMQLILNGVLETQMLQQLVAEQDIVDRQHIGLFGVKKNQEVLGMNQDAAKNNITKSPLSVSRHVGGNILSPKEVDWDMPNKNKTYNQLVIEKPLKNERHQQHVLQQMRDIAPTSQLLGKQEKSEGLSNLEEIEGVNNQVLTVSKQCASCYGFAPQILSQIKMACLSYTNSPIKYAENCSISVTDVLKIKQALLQNVEYINAELSQFLVQNKSRFKILPMVDHSALIDAQNNLDCENTIAFGVKCGNMTTHSSQKNDNFERQSVAVDSQTNIDVGMLNRGSDSQLQNCVVNTMPIFSKHNGRTSTLEINNQNQIPLQQVNECSNAQTHLQFMQSEGDQTLQYSDNKTKIINIDGIMPRQQFSDFIGQDLVIGSKSPHKAWYLNPGFKFNIPALTNLMMVHKNKSKSKFSTFTKQHENSNYPTLKVSEKDLSDIKMASQQALQLLKKKRGQSVIRIHSQLSEYPQAIQTNDIQVHSEHQNNLQNQNNTLNSKSNNGKYQTISMNTSSMTRQINVENQKYRNMQEHLVDKNYEQLLTQLKEEQDSKSQGHLQRNNGVANVKFSLIKGKSNAILNTLTQQTAAKTATGSFNSKKNSNDQFAGLYGSKLAAKRAQSKIESQTFMSRRYSRGGSNVRTATKVSTENLNSHEPQAFPQVEYQHKLLKDHLMHPVISPKSNFQTRAHSVSKTTRNNNAVA